MNEEAIEITLKVISTLETLEIRYLLGGSLASAIYGEPRATRDADIVADIKLEHVDAICRLLEPEFNISRESIFGAIEHRTSFNAIHLDTLFKVVLFLPKTRGFEEQEFHRAILRSVSSEPDRYIFVATAEDIILAKLEWYRMGNEVSGQQWRDVTAIFKINNDILDFQYMRRTATQLGVLDLLEKLVN